MQCGKAHGFCRTQNRGPQEMNPYSAQSLVATEGGLCKIQRPPPGRLNFLWYSRISFRFLMELENINLRAEDTEQ